MVGVSWWTPPGRRVGGRLHTPAGQQALTTMEGITGEVVNRIVTAHMDAAEAGVAEQVMTRIGRAVGEERPPQSRRFSTGGVLGQQGKCLTGDQLGAERERRVVESIRPATPVLGNGGPRGPAYNCPNCAGRIEPNATTHACRCGGCRLYFTDPGYEPTVVEGGGVAYGRLIGDKQRKPVMDFEFDLGDWSMAWILRPQQYSFGPITIQDSELVERAAAQMAHQST
jgi:hypothetical protein